MDKFIPIGPQPKRTTATTVMVDFKQTEDYRKVAEAAHRHGLSIKEFCRQGVLFAVANLGA